MQLLLHYIYLTYTDTLQIKILHTKHIMSLYSDICITMLILAYLVHLNQQRLHFQL